VPAPLIIDCQYLFPEFAASYLIESGGELAFVDNNTAHSVPLLLGALKRGGFGPEQVRYVIITHVHLDHAGGTSLLMRECPQATLLAHPRAAPHMIDPSKLVGSARKVYGDEQFEKLYGEIHAVPAARVQAVEDEARLTLGKTELRFLHTRGHANHHFCVQDLGRGDIFTGDAFGLRYPALQGQGLFIFPSTSPTDFDPEEARKSVHRIVDSGATTAYPTHFGAVKELDAAKEQLLAELDFSEGLLNEAVQCPLADSELDQFCHRKILEHFKRIHDPRGILKVDLELNAQGIAHVARKRRAKAHQPTS